MNLTVALAVHGDDLPAVLPVVPTDNWVVPCGLDWVIVLADVPSDRLDDGKMRDVAVGLRHVSVLEIATEGEGRIRLGDLGDSPLRTYGDSPIDPFREAILYEVLDGAWTDGYIGNDETVDAIALRNLFLNGEVVYLSVALSGDLADVAERLGDLDSRFAPEQSPIVHSLL